eukprot:5096132-Lingulodinium_polyedra.AAC.1
MATSPRDIVVRYGEVGSVWTLQKNYNVEDAILVDNNSKCTRFCMILFEPKTAAILECCCSLVL